MALDTVSILDGNTFVVSDRRGDLDATPTGNHGLFLEDTRFLSTLAADRRRQPPDDAVGGRAGLLPGAVLRGADDRDRLRRFAPVGGAAARESAPGSTRPSTSSTTTTSRSISRSSWRSAADFADLFEVKDKLTQEGRAVQRASTSGKPDARLPARSFGARPSSPPTAPGELARGRLVVHRPARAAGALDRDVRRRGRGGAPTSMTRAGRTAAAAAKREPGRRTSTELGRVGAPAGQLVGAARRHLPAQPDRPGGAALRDRRLAGRAAGGGPAVVHGDVRARQPDHQLPGAAVRPRAGGDDAAHAGRCCRGSAMTRSATRSRARSCTSCASAR